MDGAYGIVSRANCDIRIRRDRLGQTPRESGSGYGGGCLTEYQLQGIAPDDDQPAYAKTPGASTNPRQGAHTLAPPASVPACEVCGGLVRPEHGIGLRNGMKTFQGLA